MHTWQRRRKEKKSCVHTAEPLNEWDRDKYAHWIIESRKKLKKKENTKRTQTENMACDAQRKEMIHHQRDAHYFKYVCEWLCLVFEPECYVALFYIT